jgi:hypothetical protein
MPIISERMRQHQEKALAEQAAIIARRGRVQNEINNARVLPGNENALPFAYIPLPTEANVPAYQTHEKKRLDLEVQKAQEQRLEQSAGHRLMPGVARGSKREAALHAANLEAGVQQVLVTTLSASALLDSLAMSVEQASD